MSSEKLKQIYSEFFLSPEIFKIVFIVPDKRCYNKVKRIESIVEDRLLTYSIKPRAMPVLMVVLMPSDVRKIEDVTAYFSDCYTESSMGFSASKK